MKNFLKGEKGINLISLSITVIVILILTSITLYNAKANIKTSKLRAMQTDIETLTDRVSNYYAEYGNIPTNTSIEYTNITNLENSGIISTAVDTGKFYVIDLTALDNLSLNYGKDYEKIKSGEVSTEDEINTLTDIYIINYASHNIFYVEGIEVDGVSYYTNYTESDVDTASVDLKYYDGVEIPEGFYYVGGTKETGLVISDVDGDDLDNSKAGNQFVWIPVENEDEYVRETSYEDTAISADAQNVGDGSLPDNFETGNYENFDFIENQAVINAHGFFVSRFEAGEDSEGNAISKKGVELCQGYGNCDIAIEDNESVMAWFCTGLQWDAIMRFVNSSSYDVTKSDESRHDGIDLTGVNENDKVKNIYDLEGNALEETFEITSSNKIIYRGGSWGDNNPASYRSTPSDTSLTSGRIVLYVFPKETCSDTYDQTSTYTDKNGDKATIPKGFRVSTRSSENTISSGLVVQGPDGSEFVWVPVPDVIYIEGKTVNQSYTPMARTQSNSSEDYEGMLYEFDGSTSTYQSTWKVGSTNNSEPSTTYQTEYNSMIKSVKQYGGFYIGRYELGIEGTKFVSKNAKTNTSVTTADATNSLTKDWEGLYEACTSYKTDNVTGSMVWGSQYDAMANWMAKQGKKVGTSNYNRCNQTNVTGSEIGDIINNIYDLYSCYAEYTMEIKGTDIEIRQPMECYYNDDAEYSPTVRWEGQNGKYANTRISLYITE